MAWIKRITMVAAAGLLTTSCALYRLEQLRNTTPKGNAFQNELSRLYMDFATGEEREYDWWTSAYFAGKGLESAYGKDVPPENPEDWNLPDGAREEIQKSRIALMEVLTPEVQRARPAVAANAQFYFDCWVEQQSENWQAEDIAFCRDNLMEALENLRGSMPEIKAAPPAARPSTPPPLESATAPLPESSPQAMTPAPLPPVAESPASISSALPPETPASTQAPVKKETGRQSMPEDFNFDHPPEPKKLEKPADKPKDVKEKKPVTKTKTKTSGPETISYVVFFEPHKALLSELGNDVIGEVIGMLRHASDYEIVMHGSSSTTGSWKNEPGLLDERIQLVKKRLIDGGVRESAIRDAAAPESGKTLGRRVEIFLNE